MSSNTTNLPLARAGGWPAIAAWFKNAFDAYVERRSRIAEIRALEVLSDQQLADIGIRRDEIVQHVFRPYGWL